MNAIDDKQYIYKPSTVGHVKMHMSGLDRSIVVLPLWLQRCTKMATLLPRAGRITDRKQCYISWVVLESPAVIT